MDPAGQAIGEVPVQGQPGQVQAALTAQQRTAMQQLLQREPYKNFLRPDQFTPQNFPPSIMPPGQLETYKNGIKSLWDHIVKSPPDHTHHKQALGKLAEASQRLIKLRKDELEKVKRQQAQRANGVATTAQPGEAQVLQQQPMQQNKPAPQAQPQMPPAQVSAQAQAQHAQVWANLQQQAATWPPEVKQKVELQHWSLPSNTVEGSQEALKYRLEATKRYGESLSNIKRAQMVILEFEAAVKSGKEPSTQNPQRYQQAKQAITDANGFIAKLHANEQANRAAQAARIQGGQMNRAPVHGARPGADAVPANAQAIQAAQQRFAGQRPASSSIGQVDQPVPYTPGQAVAASRSQGTGPQTPQHPTAFQESRQLTGDADQRRPSQGVNKSYQPQTPQAVSMAPARPTLSGPSNGPMGSLGQPAISKPDTFMLNGPSDRVLDKKKLDELVRQICGADAGEGDALQPEVEESVLQLADEFIENVVTSACRLAKLRGSQTLELRDVQLVLERQYNIRIPGYATDEVRTVRKSLPAAGYYQKMNAIAAAKVMSGKGDA